MNSQNPKFSIIIPLYNKSATIDASIRSVLAQTFTDFELLIVDDGSTDDSVRKAAEFEDARIKIYRKENGGVSDARNYGIQHSKSENIGLLDADDIWMPNYLEEINKLIEKFPSCGLYAAAYKKIKLKKETIYGITLPEGIIENFFKTKLKHLVPWTSATVIKKSAILKAGGFPVGMIGGEDDFAWAKIATLFPVAFTPKVLAVYHTDLQTTIKRFGKLDTCRESWFDLYAEGDFYRNEFVARKAIAKGIRYAHYLNREESRRIEKQTHYTALFKRKWYKLYLLNRLPLKGVELVRSLSPAYKRFKIFSSSFRKVASSIS